MIFLKLVVLFSIISQCHSQNDPRYYSGAQAPDKWASLYPKCGGNMQSPIDIKDATEDSNLTDIVLEGYNITPTAVQVGTSANAVFSVIQGVRVNISAAGLPDVYHFDGLQIHFGSKNGQGSDHTFNGIQYEAEIQLRHLRTSLTNFNSAILEEDGVTFLSVLVEVGDENSNFEELIKAIIVIQENDPFTMAENPYPLMNYLPEKKSYYKYKGSTTTPNCDENVIWIVFINPITMSQAQIDEFRKLTNFMNTSEFLSDNFRPVQALNGRKITSFGDEQTASDCSRLAAATIICTLSLIVPLWLHLQN